MQLTRYRVRSSLLPIFLSASCLFAVTARAELVAERITDANYETHHVGGPDSDAGIGDWFLSNGTICAAISDPEHEGALTPSGGVLIDLGHCGKGDDQWVVWQPLLNLAQSHVVPVSHLSAGADADSAWIRTLASFAGVEIETTYRVTRDAPTALDIQTRTRRLEEGDSLFALGAILLHTSGQTRPFSIVRQAPEYSRGFVYPESDRHSLLSVLSSLSGSDLHVLVGSDAMSPISYGVEQRGARLEGDTGPGRALPVFSLTGLHYTMLNALTSPSWFADASGPPSVIDLLRIPLMDVDKGTRIEHHYRIWVGARADVASITDQVWQEQPSLVGSVDTAQARVHIGLVGPPGSSTTSSDETYPITELRPDQKGEYRVRLPPGRYRAVARASAGREARVDFEVEANRQDQRIAPLAVGAAARIRLPEAFVGRLVFLDADDRPLRFGQDLLGFRIGDAHPPAGLEASFLNRGGVAGDPRTITVPAGRYRVLAVRGAEYDIHETEIEAGAGEETPLTLDALPRVRRTPGWIAADLHVHSGASFDSSTPQTRQVAAFVASGAEVLVATEHDRVFDPRPALRAAGLEHALATITGVEITSAFMGGDSPHASGHLNAFPLAPIARAYRGGAPTLEGRRLHDALADVAKREPAPFVQMNHPRPGPHEGEGDTYFGHLGVAGLPYDPTLPLTRSPNAVLIESGEDHGVRDLDFHAIELLNGPHLSRYRETRADWFSFLLQGEIKVGTASSDSHEFDTIVGSPRTYVATSGDSIDTFSEADFMSSLRAGRAYGTTGPLLRARLEEAGPGDLHTGISGVLRLEVDAAPWVPISEWRVYVNGERVHRAEARAGETFELPLAFARDAFVTVEVEGHARRPYTEAFPDFVPFAFTNPIFVDADGNGRFDAPGLPAILPATLTDPQSTD